MATSVARRTSRGRKRGGEKRRWVDKGLARSGEGGDQTEDEGQKDRSLLQVEGGGSTTTLPKGRDSGRESRDGGNAARFRQPRTAVLRLFLLREDQRRHQSDSSIRWIRGGPLGGSSEILTIISYDS